MAFTLVFWGARTFQQKSTETVQTAQKTKSLHYWGGSLNVTWMSNQLINNQIWPDKKQIQQLLANFKQF